MTQSIYDVGKDEDVILNLRARVWGTDHPHTSAAFYKWLFQDTPDGPGTGVFLERDGRVAGFAGIANRRAQMGDDVLKVAHGLDFMVDPDLSGMLSGRVGVRTLNAHAKLAEELGFDCNLNYPNDSSHRMLISKQVKYQPVFAPDLYVLTLGPVGSTEGSVFKRIAFALGGGAGAVYGAMRSARAGSRIEIEPVTHFDARFDAHWQELVKDRKLRFFRDAKTLNWRYTGHPLHSYHAIAAVEGARVLGYAVATERELFGTKTLLICDLSVAGSVRDIENALLAGVKRMARDRQIKLILTQAVHDSPLERCLGRGGFLKVPPKMNPKAFRMINTVYTPLGERGLAPDAWAFSWGDMDVI